jgi:hypothetical protein
VRASSLLRQLAKGGCAARRLSWVTPGFSQSRRCKTTASAKLACLQVDSRGSPSLFAHVARTPISFPEIAKRQPLPAATFLATFLALFGLYALVYRTCRRHPREVPPALILLCGLTLALLLILTYPVGAGDVVDYVTHGEELFYYRENPLVVPPGQLPDTAFARYSAYRMAPSNYGPLWTWISALVVGALGRGSLALNLLGFKGYRARIRNHGHSCFLCEIVIRSQFHTTYEPEA